MLRAVGSRVIVRAEIQAEVDGIIVPDKWQRVSAIGELVAVGPHAKVDAPIGARVQLVERDGPTRAQTLMDIDGVWYVAADDDQVLGVYP